MKKLYVFIIILPFVLYYTICRSYNSNNISTKEGIFRENVEALTQASETDTNDPNRWGQRISISSTPVYIPRIGEDGRPIYPPDSLIGFFHTISCLYPNQGHIYCLGSLWGHLHTISNSSYCPLDDE